MAYNGSAGGFRSDGVYSNLIILNELNLKQHHCCYTMQTCLFAVSAADTAVNFRRRGWLIDWFTDLSMLRHINRLQLLALQ